MVSSSAVSLKSHIYIYIYRSIISTALDRQGTVDSNTSGYNASVHNPSKYFDKMSDVAWILTEELSKAFVPFVSFFFREDYHEPV